MEPRPDRVRIASYGGSVEVGGTFDAIGLGVSAAPLRHVTDGETVTDALAATSASVTSRRIQRAYQSQ